MLGRYRVAVTPDDVGRRVTLRTRLAQPAGGGPTTTDTLGILESWEGGTLNVRRRDGTVVTIAADTLVAARVIPGHR